MRRIRNPLYNLVVSGVRLPLSPPKQLLSTRKDDDRQIQCDNTLRKHEEDIKKMLDDMHKRRIDMADEIFVINKNGYVGSSTKSEIEYAKKLSKKINFMEN